MSEVMIKKSRAILDVVGNTPLIELERVSESSGRVFAKLELFNPGGSVKDRPAKGMILAGIESGSLREGMRILDATSGNTGIAYAWIGAALGFGVTLCLPKNASPERFAILKSFGVEIVETSPLEGTDGAQAEAKRLAEQNPELYYYPDQYSNEANWKSHFQTTGPEIWAQTNERITHFVSVVGTCGTFVGTGRFLREKRPDTKLIEVQPDSPFHGLEGIKHLPTCDIPKIYDQSLRDELVEVSTEKSQEMMRRLAREEGLLVGPSSGANVIAALQVAESAGDGAVVVTVLCDDGARYLS